MKKGSKILLGAAVVVVGGLVGWQLTRPKPGVNADLQMAIYNASGQLVAGGISGMVGAWSFDPGGGGGYEGAWIIKIRITNKSYKMVDGVKVFVPAVLSQKVTVIVNAVTLIGPLATTNFTIAANAYNDSETYFTPLVPAGLASVPGSAHAEVWSPSGLITGKVVDKTFTVNSTAIVYDADILFV